jgi:hypothetical protein
MSPDDNLTDLLQIALPGGAVEEEESGTRDADLLNSLPVASPCDASWEEMAGDDLVRFCQHCQKNVYNVSGMSRHDAAAFVREAEGRLCVRFYRRQDGTLLSDNCPVGRRSVRRWLLAGMALAAFSFITVGVLIHGVIGLREGFRQWGLAVELGQAIIFRDAHKVETVLRAGADPNAADEDDSLLLARGSPNGEKKIALLRRYGANPSRSLFAARTVEDARFLIGMGADPNAHVEDDGETPLASHFVVANVEIVRFLLQHGGDPTVRYSDGQTILQRMEYAAGNHPEEAANYAQVRALLTRALPYAPNRDAPVQDDDEAESYRGGRVRDPDRAGAGRSRRPGRADETVLGGEVPRRGGGPSWSISGGCAIGWREPL